MGNGGGRIWLIIILIVLAIWLFYYGGIDKIPGLNVSWGGFNTWFKDVAGIGLDQIITAIWRLLLWLVKFVFQLVWQVILWLVELVRN